MNWGSDCLSWKRHTFTSEGIKCKNFSVSDLSALYVRNVHIHAEDVSLKSNAHVNAVLWQVITLFVYTYKDAPEDKAQLGFGIKWNV